jgi:hypothetical protein
MPWMPIPIQIQQKDADPIRSGSTILLLYSKRYLVEDFQKVVKVLNQALKPTNYIQSASQKVPAFKNIRRRTQL